VNGELVAEAELLCKMVDLEPAEVPAPDTIENAR
jgi:hypothetical protein